MHGGSMSLMSFGSIISHNYMISLSIITINYNNSKDLKKTLESVSCQTCKDFEHVIVDGGSTDGSKELIEKYANTVSYNVNWVSEKDNGIYNAMNKGIRIANGEYIQILNSGDCLASDDVVEKMLKAISDYESVIGKIPILYGNMLKDYGNGKIVKDTCGFENYTPESFLYFYRGTLNHDCAYIRRDLFDKYGCYNEKMKICSDWEWYVRAIVIGGEKTYYTNIDVTIFEMNGISESGGINKDLIQKERIAYLELILYPSVLKDYDMYSFPITQYNRLKKHHLWGIVYLCERILFKLEKWNILR